MVPSDSIRKLTPLARDGLIILTCIIGHGMYLLVAYLGHGHLGFPLDDAWIYQTYARNLAQTGQWAFISGVPSTGSTSILWTLLIVPGHWLPVDPRWWTQFLGLMAMVAAALGSVRFFAEEEPHVSLVVGLAVALEWHLVWAAASGMETGLFAMLLIWFWVWLQRHDPVDEKHSWRHGLLTGIWGGVLMLARPEGVVAFGVGGLSGLLRSGKLADRFRWGVMAGVGFALFLVPFFGLNVLVSGEVWPNTFYAKQTEYAVLWAIPYPLRFLNQVMVGFVGAQMLLVPGLLYELWCHLRRRPIDWVYLLPWGWALLHWGLYAARLPVTYQHGRYVIPVIPLILIYGVSGMLRIVKPRARRSLVRLGSLIWLLAIALLFPLVLGILGAPAYTRDVSFIEDEMVATAQWINEHIGPDTLIAAHDIGALGYFAPRPLVDLAGLISPDVIPFMDDPDRLIAYILERGTDYLIVFPHWNAAYEKIVASSYFCPVWATSEREGYVAYSDAGPMTVYEVVQNGDCTAP